jgi:hypothetical protein
MSSAFDPRADIPQKTRTPTRTVWRRLVARIRCDDGKTSSRRNLRARDGGRRDRRGRPVLQEPVLGAADSERRNCPGVRGVLSEVPEASMSAD